MLENAPKLRNLIEPAVTRLRNMDIDVTVEIASPAQHENVDAFADEFGIPMPAEVCELFAESDGFDISWENGDDWGGFTFPSLNVLRLHRQRWINGDLPTTASEDMHAWIPFDDSGSGDLMCVDSATGSIIEFNHELSVVDSTQCSIYANGIFDYIQNCARICFFPAWIARPASEIYAGNVAVDWTSMEVPDAYRIFPD